MSIIVSDIRNIMQLKNQGLHSMLKAQKTVLASDNAHIPISSIAHAEFEYGGGKREIIYEVPVFVDLNAVLETTTIEIASRAFYSSYIVRSFKREQYTYMILRGIILCTGNIMVPTMFMALCTHRDKIDAVKNTKWNSFSDLVLFIDKRFHSRAHSYMWRNMNRNIVLALQALGTEIRFVDSVEDECAKVSCIQVDIPSNIAVTEADKYISDRMNSKLRVLLNPPVSTADNTDENAIGTREILRRRVRRARPNENIGIEIEDDTEPSPPRVLDASDLQTQVTYTPIPTNFTGYHVGVDPIRYQAATSARVTTTGTIPQGVSEEEAVATYQYQPFSMDVNAIPANPGMDIEEMIRLQEQNGVMLLDNRESLRLEQEIRSDMYDLQLPVAGNVVQPIDLTSLDRTTREYTETLDRLRALMNAQMGIPQEIMGEPQPREDMSP